MSPRSGFLEPDGDQLKRFIHGIFRYADEGTYVSLRSFTHNDGDRPFDITPVEVNGDLDKVVSIAVRAARRAANHGEPIVFAPPVATFTNPDHAAEADLANGVALSVECDAHPGAARHKLEGLLGPPTFVVASGGTWTDPATGVVEDKLHLHWVLNEPTRTPEDHARLKLARKLAAVIAGSDPTAVPNAHPLRWSGSWHRKGEPRLCRTVEENPDAEIDLGDAVDRLEAAAKAAGLSLEKIKATASGEDRETSELIKQIFSGAEYSSPLVALSARYAGWGMSAKKIEQTLRGFLDAVPEDVRDKKDNGIAPGRWAARVNDLGRIARSAVTKFKPKVEEPTPGEKTAEASREQAKSPPAEQASETDLLPAIEAMNQRYFVAQTGGRG